ncbi:MAG: sulfotransferase domain-containing protein [Hydrococcus sp. SU_1_0]|nr:sulfotransferase domain-containing protein [Hydrococcus sp. SU_1_0]
MLKIFFTPRAKKELEFFSYYHKEIAEHGLNFYLKPFNQFEDLINPEKPKAIGEATPSYFWSINPDRQWSNPPNQNFNLHIPESVHQLLGSELKLILCLRDPVERAISAYFHHVKRNRICYQSQRILDVGHLYGIIDMGFYSQHLNAWLSKFSLDNFKFLIYERDIKQNKQRTIVDICNFLEVDHQLFPTTANLDKYHNQGLKYRSTEDGVFLIFPNRNQEKLVINRAEIQSLRKIYQEDFQSLQHTLQVDLSEFWQFN